VKLINKNKHLVREIENQPDLPPQLRKGINIIKAGVSVEQNQLTFKPEIENHVNLEYTFAFAEIAATYLLKQDKAFFSQKPEELCFALIEIFIL